MAECRRLYRDHHGSDRLIASYAALMNDKGRYIRLKSMGIETQVTLALAAAHFFSPISILARRENNQGVTPAAAQDFMVHLKELGILGEQPDRYVHQIRDLLDRLAANGILVDMGGGGTNVMMPKSYYCFHEMSGARAAGVLWLAKTLGGRLVHWAVSPAVVHLTGQNDQGDSRQGSGVIFHKQHVLTCAHVVSDMMLDCEQNFGGRQVTVEDTFIHPDVDVAVIRFNEELETVPGLLFLPPEVSRKVYRFGYSRIPRSVPGADGQSPMVMQSGEVTNESLTVFGGNKAFLYSAVSRPGDSGGPIVSEHGYVVGITSELSDGRTHDGDREEIFSPHYVGIPADVVARAVDDLELGVRIPYENFD